MTLHYHGTPISKRDPFLLEMAGKCFCVSFAAPSDAETCLRIGQSIMWDNGAFTAYTQKKKYDSEKYYRWVEPKLFHPHWAIPPDTIGGSENDNDDLLAEWPFPKDFSAPVWHLHESLDRLVHLCEEWPKVCFGSSEEYWKVGSEIWERRADEAFNTLGNFSKLPWIYMLRGMACTGKRWPFSSVDSASVGRNLNSARQYNPEYKARTFDSVQCPGDWKTRTIQKELL